MPNHVAYAEHCAEMANEAETKKEAGYYWKEYRKAMIVETGNPNLFRKPKCYTNRPSKSLSKTLSSCACGAESISWTRKHHEYEMPCKCECSHITHSYDGEYKSITCGCCGKTGVKQPIENVVKFVCPDCGKETEWYTRNSYARNGWNLLQEVR